MTKLQKQISFIQQFKAELPNLKDAEFENACFRLFEFQYENNLIYREYIRHLGYNVSKIEKISDIPFLPVTFFRDKKVVSTGLDYTACYESSGTTGSMPGRLYFYDEPFYHQNSERIFRSFFGDISQYSFFFLLPSYLERKNSSLISMVNHFHKLSDSTAGGFYLHDQEKLSQDLQMVLRKKQKKVILWGVTFALLDFAEGHSSDYEGLIVLETGGMKGRGKEPLRSEVHQILENRLNVKNMYSEYGMTELFSQAYTGNGSEIFYCHSPMKILIRELEDPLQVHFKQEERGGVNIIDLANADTCAFIETQDLGILTGDGFRILGRFDNADLRGCSLMLQNS